MALTFPLSLDKFNDLVPVESVEWTPQYSQTVDGLASGLLIGTDLGPTLWRGAVSTIQMKHDRADGIQAIIESFDGVLNDFYICNPRRYYPIADPTGGGIIGADPKIQSINANNKELDIKDLPAGYVLSPGDMFSFDYATSRRAFHRVVVGGTADGLGDLPNVEVRPHIRPGATAETSLTFVKPSMRALMLPNTMQTQTTTPVSSKISFEIIQSLRA